MCKVDRNPSTKHYSLAFVRSSVNPEHNNANVLTGSSRKSDGPMEEEFSQQPPLTHTILKGKQH
jgi:hypothetical protein